MQIQRQNSLQGIPSSAWQALVDPAFPFLSLEFLISLETSSCIGKHSGWLPEYLLAYEGDTLVGALLLYEKYNSEGEFIFDWEWAMAYARHGYRYYPKLISALPFTPVMVPKFLVHPEVDASKVRQSLLEEALRTVESRAESGLHFFFVPREELDFLESQGFLPRFNFQLYWNNHSFRSFQDFTATLKRKGRQDIERERRQIKASGLTIENFSGASLGPKHASVMFDFYASTYYKKGCEPYLNLEFFQEIFKKIPEKILLVLARDGEKWIGGSISLIGQKRLYGRYWGCSEEYRHLHFELCYYQTVDYAIAHGLEAVEAGAGGGHKIPRGFVPHWTYSAHRIEHPQFREAIARFLIQEKTLLEDNFREVLKSSPYREIPSL